MAAWETALAANIEMEERPLAHAPLSVRNAILPDGENRTPYLAVTTIAVEQDDFVTTIFELQ